MLLFATACGSDTEEVPTAAVNPDTVSQTAGSLIGVPIEGEDLTCLVSDADGDTQLTDLYTRIGTPEYQVTPEAFTALAVSVHGCISADALATSLVPLAGATTAESATQFTSCAVEQIEASPNGDLAYVGLSAIFLGLVVPEGAQPSAITAASACIDSASLASQLASSREQSSGFVDEVDRECLEETIDDDFRESFWDGVIVGTGDTEQLIADAIDPCTSTFDSGLPTDIPDDFVPWSGEGVLAGVDPFGRNGIYTDAPPNQLEAGVDYQAVLTTADGEIVIDLFEDVVPETVNSFVSLARDGFYDGTRFHRVLEGFMAQGGDPLATGFGGAGYTFADEEAGLVPIDRRGLLAMANSGPDSNGSQFFITLAPAQHLDGLHTVFGEVLSGDDVLANIDLRNPDAPTSRGEELITVEITES